MVNKELILKEIYEQNLFWNKDKEGLFFEKTIYRRKLFFTLLDYIAERQIVSIVGLRRVGKTVLLKQLIRHLIDNKKINPKNILFLSFDEVLVADKLTLSDYLSVYLENIRPDEERMVFIFLDEIQYIDKWQHILKRYYDTRANIKFVISGSSSLFLRKKTTESLAGRIYEFKLDILSFSEYLGLTGKDSAFIKDYARSAVEIKKIDINELSRKRSGIENFLAARGNEAQKYFKHYLSFGQFPETAAEPDAVKAAKYIKESVYKKTIEYDIPRIFDVDKIGALKFLYEILINETGNTIELQNIASETGINQKTLSDYLDFLGQSMLADIIYSYAKSFRKSRRSAKKIYVASTNFCRLDGNSSPPVNDQAFGHLAETYAFYFLKNNFSHVATYRVRGREIDFVAADDLRDNRNFLFVEVKYREQAREKELEFLKNTSQKISSRPYLALTKNEFYVAENGLCIPLYLAL